MKRKYDVLLAIGLLGLIAGFVMCYLLMCYQVISFQQNLIGRVDVAEELSVQEYMQWLFEKSSLDYREHGKAVLLKYGFTEKGTFFIGRNMGLFDVSLVMCTGLLMPFLFVVFMCYKKEKIYKSKVQELQKEIVFLRQSQMEEDYMQQQQKQTQQFIENIAHQIKTPISRIVTSLELIENHLNDEKAKTRIKECYAHLESVNRLMRQLMNIARLEAGKVMFQKEALYIGELLRETAQGCCEDDMRIQIRMHRSANGAKNQKKDVAGENLTQKSDSVIEEKVRDNIWVYDDGVQKDTNMSGQQMQIGSYESAQEDILYYGDMEWLKEAFSNILNNALEADKSNQAIEVTYCKTEDFIRVSIHDHGPGLSENDIPNIFNRFYLPEETKASHIGIGLNLAKLIIGGHLGSVYAYNHAEGGAVFQILLPVYASLKAGR